MKVRILWYNDTAGKPLKAPQVVVGTSVFSPSTAAKTQRGVVGPVAYRATTMLIVRPDGPSGRSFKFPIVVTAAMQPNSDPDGIRVAVSDTEVRVVGNPVVYFDQKYAR